MSHDDEELEVVVLPGAVDARGAGAEEPLDPDAAPGDEPQSHEPEVG